VNKLNRPPAQKSSLVAPETRLTGRQNQRHGETIQERTGWKKNNRLGEETTTKEGNREISSVFGGTGEPIRRNVRNVKTGFIREVHKRGVKGACSTWVWHEGVFKRGRKLTQNRRSGEIHHQQKTAAPGVSQCRKGQKGEASSQVKDGRQERGHGIRGHSQQGEA